MSALEQYLSVAEKIEPWERGMLLMEVLHELGETKESYTDFLGASDEESLFSLFNIKRFYKYSMDKNSLTDGFYWIMVRKDEWEVAYYDSSEEEFSLTNGDMFLKEDIILVDLEQITRKEEDSEEG